jgi:hypothetical protein
MDRKTPSVSDVVRRAVELCDPDDVDQTLGRLEEQFEDDDEPITAVENLEERVAIAVEGADYDAENPAVAVASAVVLLPRGSSRRGRQRRGSRPGDPSRRQSTVARRPAALCR